MPAAAIYLPKQEIALLWGVSAARVSQLLKNFAPDAYRDEGLSLSIALKFRGTSINREAFDEIVSRGFAILDGGRVDPVAAASAQGLYEIYEVEPPQHPKGGRPAGSKTAPAAAPEVAPVKSSPVADRHDALAAMRMAKLQAEIDGRVLKTSREAGELVSKAAVIRDLKAAGAIVQSTLGLLPGRLSALVQPADRPEVMRQAEAIIERAIYAVMSALGDSTDD